MLKVSVIVTALILSVSSVANAGSLEDTEFWERVQTEIDAKAVKSSKTCDTVITAAIDISSFAGVDLAHAPIQAYGRDAVAALENVCNTGASAKKAVQGQIKTVTLRRGKSGTQVALEKDKSELVVYIDPAKTGISGKKPGSYSWVSAIKEVL